MRLGILGSRNGRSGRALSSPSIAPDLCETSADLGKHGASWENEASATLGQGIGRTFLLYGFKLAVPFCDSSTSCTFRCIITFRQDSPP
jgi:hypothetical protein